MPSKTNSTAPDTRETPDSHRPSGSTPEPRPQPARPAPVPRPSRGASVIPAPRKAELGLHRVAFAARPPPTREQIAARAYEIWQQSGCLPARDAENWAQAERELSAGCAAQESSAHQG
jgi:Protein of unknown function (DUF2934)